MILSCQDELAPGVRDVDIYERRLAELEATGEMRLGREPPVFRAQDELSPPEAYLGEEMAGVSPRASLAQLMAPPFEAVQVSARFAASMHAKTAPFAV